MAERKELIEDIPIGVRVFDNRTLFLRMAGATATDSEGRKYDCGTSMSDGHPMIVMPDGRWAVFTWDLLIPAAIAALEAQDKAKGVTDG